MTIARALINHPKILYWRMSLRATWILKTASEIMKTFDRLNREEGTTLSIDHS